MANLIEGEIRIKPCPPGSLPPWGETFWMHLIWFGLLGFNASATTRVISRRWNDDEISFLVEETGVPGGNHRSTARNWWNLHLIRNLTELTWRVFRCVQARGGAFFFGPEEANMLSRAIAGSWSCLAPWEEKLGSNCPLAPPIIIKLPRPWVSQTLLHTLQVKVKDHDKVRSDRKLVFCDADIIKSEWVSEWCRQLRPSSRRELVSGSNSHVMGEKKKKKDHYQTTHKSLYIAAAFNNSKITSGLTVLKRSCKEGTW